MDELRDIIVPHFNLKGKVAVITGGTKGLGFGMAVTFARYGADVVVASRTKADCERVGKELTGLGVKGLGIPTDVTRPAEVDNLADLVMEKMGRLDIMVCNAGSGATYKAVDFPEEEWDRVLDVDLKGVFLCARAAARKMIAQGKGGRVINIASAAGLKGTVGISAYCAAKAGVVNLTKALAVEWARYSITVNAICPGYVPTAINAHKLADPKIREKIEMKTALRRVGKIEEIAAAALYLASDFSGYMTGSHILVDGGGAAS
jgi:NAD(P)-dependent dehydrogenase (short-subunit alcohol dehydrogenase family)